MISSKLKQVGILLLLFLLIPGIYAATCPLQFSPGAILGGDVTINNEEAPIGTVIEAYAAGGGHDFNTLTPDGNTTVYTAGKYWPLAISACFFGEEITFKINGLNASQIYYYYPGEIKFDFNLSVDGLDVCTDNDEDGYSIEGGNCGEIDCDDDNPNINPGATESCNEIDDDCDTEIDENNGDCSGETPYCVEGVCVECVGNEDCEATECDDSDGCVGYDYYDYEDVDNGCLTDFTCEQNECGEPAVYENDSRCYDQLDVYLKEGWNLISVPLVSDNMTAGNIFRDIGYTRIFTYIDGKWHELDDNSLIDPKRGYWINSLNEQTLVVRGMESEDIVFDLNQGWNLIGYLSLDEALLSEVLDGIEYLVVYSYDDWSSYVPDRSFNSLTTMKPGYGYWVNVE